MPESGDGAPRKRLRAAQHPPIPRPIQLPLTRLKPAAPSPPPFPASPQPRVPAIKNRPYPLGDSRPSPLRAPLRQVLPAPLLRIIFPSESRPTDERAFFVPLGLDSHAILAGMGRTLAAAYRNLPEPLPVRLAEVRPILPIGRQGPGLL